MNQLLKLGQDVAWHAGKFLQPIVADASKQIIPIITSIGVAALSAAVSEGIKGLTKINETLPNIEVKGE